MGLRLLPFGDQEGFGILEGDLDNLAMDLVGEWVDGLGLPVR